MIILGSKKESDSACKVDASLSEQKLNNYIASKKPLNHVRHSSAPSQPTRQANSQIHNSEKKTRVSKSKVNSSFSDDADKTFESFVTYDTNDKKADSTAHNRDTQISERQNQDHDNETYFRSRESKRIDSAVKKAQRAYYETYLKELQQDTTPMIPHPPSQPSRPDIRRPVNTNRINR